MELTGRIIHVLPEQSGTSQRGTWRKQEYVIEIPGDYPKQVCFQVWGEKIDEFGIEEGQDLTIHIDLQSREYNGRWYTDVKAWRIQQPGQASNQASEYQAGQGGSDANASTSSASAQPDFDDDIPF